MRAFAKTSNISIAGVICGLVMAFAPGIALAAEARDCSKASSPEMKAQCEARNKASAKCENEKGPDRRKCMYEALPRDCTTSDNKARCEAEVAAHKSCRTKSGEDYAKCTRDKKG